MTLEIYDYLWIRNVLIAVDTKELVESIVGKEEYMVVVKCISSLMQNEDFLLAYPEAQNKVSDIVQTYRFKYNDKEIFDDINYIIGRLNDYKNMPNERKNYLVNQFYVQEATNRDLPFMYKQSPDVIKCLIQNDIHTYKDIFCYSAEGEKAVQLDVFDVLDYVSLTNLMLNQFPNFFEDENYKKPTVHNLEQLSTLKKLPLDISRYIKKTIKKLEPTKQKRLFF